MHWRTQQILLRKEWVDLELTGDSYKDKIKKNIPKNQHPQWKEVKQTLKDDFRVALELLRGYEILGDANHPLLLEELNTKLNAFIRAILSTERAFKEKLESRSC